MKTRSELYQMVDSITTRFAELGKCKMLSRGLDCDCLRCSMDKLMNELNVIMDVLEGRVFVKEQIHYISIEDRSWLRDDEIFIVTYTDRGFYLADQQPQPGDVGKGNNDHPHSYLWMENVGWRCITSDPAIAREEAPFTERATKRTRERFRLLPEDIVSKHHLSPPIIHP